MLMPRAERTKWSWIAGLISWFVTFVIGVLIWAFVHADLSRVAAARERYRNDPNSKGGPANTTFLTDIVGMPLDEFIFWVIGGSILIGIFVGVFTKICLEIERNRYPR